MMNFIEKTKGQLLEFRYKFQNDIHPDQLHRICKNIVKATSHIVSLHLDALHSSDNLLV